uniref:Uncharacterized protein n=1 Tax=viral metagenome TaxID=1070528 RepID=A0A6C0IXX0_9ZZZZ
MSQQEQKSKLIERINGLVENLGSSSWKIIDLDQFDGKIYREKVYCQQIEGGKYLGLYYPYDDISFNPEMNQWMMDCANMWFRQINNIIPSIKSGSCFHTFPKYFNIQRTSKIEGEIGKIQPGRLMTNSAICIRKSNSKPELPEQLYVSIEFQDTPTDDIKQIERDLDSAKSVPLIDLAKLNNITEFDFCFKFPKILESELNSGKSKVLNHYINQQNNWIKNTIQPLVDDVLKNHNLKINMIYL